MTPVAPRPAFRKEARVFKTKAALALELILHLRSIGAAFEAAGYGKDPALLRALDDAGETFVADVHRSQRIRTPDPWPAPPLPAGGGRKPTAPRAAAMPPVTVAQWIADRLRTHGPRPFCAGARAGKSVSNTSMSACIYGTAKRSSPVCGTCRPGALDKNGQPEEISWTLSNAPADTPAVRLVHMDCGRYFTERGFQDAKTSLGLADYQTRSWKSMASITRAM